MSADKFDKELSTLYQQRKQQIQPPVIRCASETKTTKTQRSPWQMLTLLLTGGVASFGIMALITHFAKSPVHGVEEQYKQHSVRVIELTEVHIEQKTLPKITPPLPPIPNSETPTSTSNTQPEAIAIDTKPILALNKNITNMVNVPTVEQPKLTVNPIHRVMPKYPESALYARKSGTVKLQYRISNTGNVVDIVSINPHGNRQLEHSAKKALAKWRYATTSASDKLLEVEFEFNLDN